MTIYYDDGTWWVTDGEGETLCGFDTEEEAEAYVEAMTAASKAGPQ